jgi:sec-independent protein translocase protein TatC
MSNATPKDPDDFFADTRMSFGDHIEDLRTHLWRAVAGFGVALFLSFFVGHIVVRFITAPVKAELDRFYNKRVKTLMAEKANESAENKVKQISPSRSYLIPRKQFDALRQGKPAAEINKMPRPRIVTKEEEEEEKNPGFLARSAPWLFGESKEKDPTYNDAKEGSFEKIVVDAKNPDPDLDKHFYRLWIAVENPLFVTGDQQEAQRKLLDIDNPTTLNVTEAFMVWFKVCIVCGIVLGSPWIFWQIWMFVAAGLYPHEKKLVHVYLPVSLFLFLAGVVVCELLVIPKAIEALLWFNEWLGMKPDMRLNEWLSFAIFMPLVFGLSFQTPLVMLFLARLGIMDVDSFRNKRRVAWFAMAVFAAVVTPSVDALSMLFLWVPMSLLFELGIFLIRLTPHPSGLDVDAPEPDEMVEV